MIERTLSLIKPDAVQRNLTGEILAMNQGTGGRVLRRTPGTSFF